MAKTLNNILISILLSSLLWCWTRYLTSSNIVAFCVAILSILLYILIARLGNRRHNDNKKVSKDTALSLAVALALSPQQLDIVANMYHYYGYKVTKKDVNCILVDKDNYQKIVMCCIDLSPLQPHQLIAAAKLAQQHGIVAIDVVHSEVSTNALATLQLLKQYNIRLVDCAALYTMLSDSNLLPKLQKLSVSKPTVVASYALNRHRTKYYCGSAIFLVLISAISYFPLYTLIWATILTAIALYSYFNKRYNTTTKLLV